MSHSHHNDVSALLKHHNVRSTSVRRAILDKFMEAGNEALSHNDLESKFDEIDRVTLYRGIKTFLSAGIIHQAIDGTGKTKYAMCADDHCRSHEHLDEHAHFYCRKCEKTVCIQDVALPEVQSVKGFTVEDVQMVLSGICDDCS